MVGNRAKNASPVLLGPANWLAQQPRTTQCYCYVLGQLNDAGISPEGRTLQPWIRAQLGTITAPNRDEIAGILTALIAEKAITQAQINGFLNAHTQVRRK